jgi:hypothetical protein
MKKGIIMEIDGAFLTLLTPEGEFLRSKRQEQIYTIGEEIHFFPITNVQTRKSLFLLKNIPTTKSVWAVIAALFILFGSFLPLYQNNKAYAYMSIDGNSSIELGVNKQMQVVKITGFNKEGKKVISELSDWKKKDVSKITKAILTEMKQAGLLEDHQSVIISTVRAKKQDEQSEKELQKNIDEIKASAGKQELKLTLLNATPEDLNKAHNLGISTGKFQEDRYQFRQKEKQKKRNAKQKQNAVPSSQNEVIPPGQSKKINETNASTAPVKESSTQGPISSVRITNSPGQLKKEENQFKQHQGYTKQQTTLQTNQQTKKQPQQQVHSNGKNQWKAKGKSANTNHPQKKSEQKEAPQNNGHKK